MSDPSESPLKPYKLPKRNTKTCYCPAYSFPHRLGGGNCNANKMCEHGHLTPEHPDYYPDYDYCKLCAKLDEIDQKFESYFDR